MGREGTGLQKVIFREQRTNLCFRHLLKDNMLEPQSGNVRKADFCLPPENFSRDPQLLWKDDHSHIPVVAH